MKHILITGAKGFVGKNLVAELSRFPEEYTLLCADIDTPAGTLDKYLGLCDAVVHLAGVNRPKQAGEFFAGNVDYLSAVLTGLENKGRAVPFIVTSSIQAALDNAYGVSKKQGEDAVFAYGARTGAPVYVFRLPNVFGKWCRPNYNSAVATFCHNIANGLPIQVNAPERVMTLVYIDEVLRCIIACLEGKMTAGEDGFCAVETVYEAPLQAIADKIYAFHACRETLEMPVLGDGLDKALYSTYLSYLPADQFAYTPVAHSDPRGLFAELFKTKELGQFSVSTTAPGVTRGNHWHHTKVEKFIVVAGEAALRFRKIDSDEVIEYHVSGDEPTVVDIPVGYTHSIVNTSETETLITLIWANEQFDPNRPDTYFLEV